ncbi:MAG: hypothetical protein WCP58_08180 [bacterium]
MIDRSTEMKVVESLRAALAAPDVNWEEVTRINSLLTTLNPAKIEVQVPKRQEMTGQVNAHIGNRVIQFKVELCNKLDGFVFVSMRSPWFTGGVSRLSRIPIEELRTLAADITAFLAEKGKSESGDNQSESDPR